MNRTYVVQGRNGYWAVDERWSEDSGTHGDPLTFKVRSDAVKVAVALTRAYRHGQEDAAAMVATVTHGDGS